MQKTDKTRLKFTVNGFHQMEMVKHGFDCTDGVILEYIADLSTCQNLIKSVGPDGGWYFWINYTAIRLSLPIIKMSNISIGRRLKKYAIKGIIKLWIDKNPNGTYSMIRFDEGYDSLKYSKK